MTFTIKNRTVFGILAASVVTLIAGKQWMATAQTPAADLTPGMLFGPLYVGDGQHIELCSSFLSPNGIKATVHFRNLTTNEVSANQDVSIPTGGGACVNYQGKGLVVGLARGEGAASDWVSPSNALISTMSVIDDNAPIAPGVYRTSVKAAVQGVAKIWVRGL